MTGLYPPRIKQQPIDSGKFLCRSCATWMLALLRCASQRGNICTVCHHANVNRRQYARRAKVGA